MALRGFAAICTFLLPAAIFAGCAGRPTPPAEPGGRGAVLRAVDGGPDFYARFRDPLPVDPTFFPIGVWVERVATSADTTADATAGINTYVGLTAGSDPRLVGMADMHLIADSTAGDHGRETVGWMLADEVDMWAGPGGGRWSGDAPDPAVDTQPDSWPACQPSTVACGYSVQDTLGRGFPRDGRLRYANYGKGVAFWESDEQASRFVNDFADLVSIDTYWFTDPRICAAGEGGRLLGGEALSPQRCRRAVNYGATIDRLRALVRPRGARPVWIVVELGHPTRVASAPTITPDQVRAAVWSGLIHGARGVVYFGHSAAGPCPTQHALRDPCYAGTRTMVSGLNAQIRSLAPVLNAPTVDGVLTRQSDVDSVVKWSGDHFYVFAQSTRTAAHTATVRLDCVGDAEATVIGEDRHIGIRGGSFTDSFTPDGVHLYRIDGGSSCGAR